MVQQNEYGPRKHHQQDHRQLPAEMVHQMQVSLACHGWCLDQVRTSRLQRFPHCSRTQVCVAEQNRYADHAMHAEQDEALKNLMMSWYYAGYYTGLYEGQQRANRQS
jgi:hypothetical protein